jgi:positive regulator of sigma E activity
MNKNLKIILSGDNGRLSSKRVVALICVVALLVSFFVAQFTGMIAPQYMFETISYIAMSGLGFTVIERFSNIFKTTKTPKDKTGEA